MLSKVKLALRISTTAFDVELNDLMNAAIADLQVAGIQDDVLNNPEGFPLVTRAVITYCKMHFGEPADPARLKASYDEQKAQMQTATGYTDWGED